MRELLNSLHMQDLIRNELANVESLKQSTNHNKTTLHRFQLLIQEHQHQQLNMLNEICLISNIMKVNKSFLANVYNFV